MKSQKQTKLLFGFALSMMDKAIEMQNAKNKFQELKNKEIIDGIMKDKRFPSGGILVEIGKKRPNGEKDDCNCIACQLLRQLEKGENGLN